jgi:DME family drug/metabolite transporter
MVAACAGSWGIIGILVREIDLAPMVIVFFRVALAAGAVALALLVLRRLDLLRRPPPAVHLLGVLLAVHWSLYFAAIKETSVASAVLITYAAPIFMALLAPVLIRERVPRTSAAALAVSMAGIALITLSGGSGSGAVRPLGVALAVLAAITYAFLIVLLKKYASRVDPVTVAVHESTAAAVVLSPALLLAGVSLDATEAGYLLLLGAGLTGLAGIVYLTALRWIPATTAGILAYVEPVSAALLAALLLGEPLTAGIVVGGLAIVAAGVVVAASVPAPAVEEPVPAR